MNTLITTTIIFAAILASILIAQRYPTSERNNTMTIKRFENYMKAVGVIAIVGIVAFGLATVTIGGETPTIILGIAIGLDALLMIGSLLLSEADRNKKRLRHSRS